ncbi:MAG: glycosyltransferase family 2 protein [Bacteroidetes bacterium]|nr:glycosyltransferase family 2 protein [Bacteroidota bacterium]
MASLSVVTLTLNEERNIADCLESARWANEIIVVDSGSTDRTLEIARKYTDKIVEVEWTGYGAARNVGILRATGDWILWLDADERVSPELADEIKAILRQPDPDISGYRIARRAYFLGRWIKHAGWYPARVARLFLRVKGKFTESRVHERSVVDGSLANIDHDLLHFTDPDLTHYFVKFNRYTTLAAQDMHTGGRRFSLADLLIRPPFVFFKMYVLRLGFLDGIQGLILSVVSAAYVFTKYAKLWELTRQ